jgi:hypothetical protein
MVGVRAGAPAVRVGVGVIEGDDWLIQDEKAIRQNNSKEQRKVVRFPIIDLSPLYSMQA